MEFVNTTTFDLNNRYLIGYGKHKIFILNLETNKSEIYEINRAIYIEIMDLKLKSSEDGQYQCMVACLRKGVNQIIMLDINEYFSKLNDPLNK